MPPSRPPLVHPRKGKSLVESAWFPARADVYRLPNASNTGSITPGIDEFGYPVSSGLPASGATGTQLTTAGRNKVNVFPLPCRIGNPTPGTESEWGQQPIGFALRVLTMAWESQPDVQSDDVIVADNRLFRVVDPDARDSFSLQRCVRCVERIQ